MKKFLFLILFSPTFLLAQQRINSNFTIQSQNKLYSIYVPSTYNAASANKMMLGLHPWNTARWNAVSWCDTLIDFAEANNLLLVCPDGGLDGQVNDPIDITFTTALLDSMKVWYNVDTSKTYVMGFSWGGLTTYTYGLANVEKFGGFMPIGAAINGAGPITSISANAKRKPFYVVHGNNDAPNVRYTPLINELNAKGAILKSLLMPGVGHTIDFPNRNTILTDAFMWIDSVNCFQVDSAATLSLTPNASFNNQPLKLFPNPSKAGDIVTVDLGDIIYNGAHKIQWRAIDGAVVKKGEAYPKNQNQLELKTTGIKPGTYILEISNDESNHTTKVIIH